MSDYDFSETHDVRDDKPDLPTTLTALQAADPNRPDATVFYGLSGLGRDDIDDVMPVWVELSPAYRRKIMREMVELSEADFEMDYRALGLMALDDDDPGVRESAIEVLWEDQSLELMSRLVQMAGPDEVREVRAAAVTALGRFILAGELEELPEDETMPACDMVLALLMNGSEDVLVRRRALESMANCGHEVVPAAIREAYFSTNREMRISAVFAMGRTFDEQWHEYVLEEIQSDDPEMCYEAVRAAGELEMIDAVPLLGRFAMGEDREIQMVAVWSLGEIGGDNAMRILELLAEHADEADDADLIDAVEDAIGNAALISDDIPNTWML